MDLTTAIAWLIALPLGLYVIIGLSYAIFLPLFAGGQSRTARRSGITGGTEDEVNVAWTLAKMEDKRRDMERHKRLLTNGKDAVPLKDTSQRGALALGKSYTQPLDTNVSATIAIQQAASCERKGGFISSRTRHPSVGR